MRVKLLTALWHNHLLPVYQYGATYGFMAVVRAAMRAAVQEVRSK